MQEFNNSHEVETQLLEKDAQKEVAVKDERHWVRLTRLCNQRCKFCLDSWNHNGTYVDSKELEEYIRKGREEGKTRLILSGGEPTIHPDFIKFVRLGRQLGYRWVQCVTNGMLFGYPKFARAAKQAGLHEATFSIHGHTAKLQDQLTGTPGAFDSGIQGIRNLQALGGVVVNVDIVINKQNYKQLREILDYFLELGVTEFDLLYIIPFGRGFEDYRSQLFFELDDDAYPYFQKAFEVSKIPGVYLWTNRLPVHYLENYEHLIQDPHKLHYEINGGRHNFEGLARWGVPPDCYGERCDHCFLAKICRDTLMPYQQWLKEGSFERVCIDLDTEPERPERQRKKLQQQEAQGYWFRTSDLSTLASGLNAWSAEETGREDVEVVVEPTGTGPTDLSSLGDLDVKIDRWVVQGPERIKELLVGTDEKPALISGALGEIAQDFEIILGKDGIGVVLDLEDQVKAHADRLVFTLRNHEYVSESREHDPVPDHIQLLAKIAHRFRNIPQCVTGYAPEGNDRRVLWDGYVDAKGLIDLDAYVHHYVVQEYYSKSVRCGDCVFNDSCEGLHINYIRNHGYKLCEPIDAEESGVEKDSSKVKGAA